MLDLRDTQSPKRTRGGGSLGNTANSVAKPVRSRLIDTRRAINQAGGYRDEELRRQRDCGREGLSSVISVMLNGDTAYIAGVETCGSVWACPVCRAKVLSKRGNMLQAAADEWRAMGNSLVMLSLTRPHTRAMTLAEVKGKSAEKTGFMGALRRLKQYRAFRALIKSWGYRGDVRSLETTYGGNGWHLHAHYLLFLEGNYQLTAADRERLRVIWAAVCIAAGTKEPNQHGAVVTQVEGAADYVVKWGAPSEVSSQQVKRAKNGNLSIAEMEDLVYRGDNTYLPQLREYYLTMKGTRLLTISGDADFRAMLRGVLDKSDEELAAETELLEDAQEVAVIERGAWEQIYWRGLVGDVLNAAESGGFEGVLRVVQLKLPHLVGSVRKPREAKKPKVAPVCF